MRLSRSILAAACAAAVALSSVMGAGEAEARRKKSHDRPGDFDFYLMAFSLAPSFCATQGRGKEQCRNPSDAAYRATPLTVHGLWPNRKGVSVNLQPSSCSTQPLALSSGLRRKLAVYMPGVADDLDEHEWKKHGVCSGLSPEEYFGKIVAIAEEANATIGAVLKEKGLLGREVAVRALLDGVAEKNRALAGAIVVDCKSAPKRRGGREDGPRAYVAEIHVLISRNIAGDPDRDGWPGTFVPLREAGVGGANSGCPGGVGFIPGGFGS